ncbi:hypothetical protein M433DRAFT_157569 [Acidomyces richmondensis BFW]|nr:hypothetical protein M433DRAFT_158420 [Acidomyces richmondensis BFW]KYG42713.1 hypothetical protein M433DRAFT_157569 [Acidomyces richmondensis BFW]
MSSVALRIKDNNDAGQKVPRSEDSKDLFDSKSFDNSNAKPDTRYSPRNCAIVMLKQNAISPTMCRETLLGRQRERPFGCDNGRI